jgi:hypothetical protein
MELHLLTSMEEKYATENGYQIPNIAHYMWFQSGSSKEFLFHHFVCAISLVVRQRPTYILFWHDSVPTGIWWDRFQALVRSPRSPTRLIMVIRPTPVAWGHRAIIYPEAKSDQGRLDALRSHGGMYFDLDVLTIRPLDTLRVHPMVMGYEDPARYGLCAGNMMAARNSTFLKNWYDHYVVNYNPKCWGCDAVVHPARMAKGQPESVIHTEFDTMNRPGWQSNELPYLYGNKTWDFRKNYNVHLWYRWHKIEYTPSTLNLTLPVCVLFEQVLKEAAKTFAISDLENGIHLLSSEPSSVSPSRASHGLEIVQNGLQF